MRPLFLLALAAILFFGCLGPQPPPNITNNTTVPPQPPPQPPPAPPPANNTTVIPPGYEVSDYCQEDSDCVRLKSCCDCGLGTYVNRYHQVNTTCEGPSCMCPIQLSHGECQERRCVAVADEVPPPAEEKVSIFSFHGECGSAVEPARTETDQGITLRGEVQAPSPCYYATALVKKVSAGDDHYYVLNVTAKPTGAEVCVKCVGAIPWEINVTNFWGRVDVYYGSQKVYPDKAGFCGWSTNGSCVTDSDCYSGGCSGQVCQSKGEDPVVTTCEFRECYSAPTYGVGCGCVAGRCRWN